MKQAAQSPVQKREEKHNGGYIHYKQEALELLSSLGYRSFAIFEMFTRAWNLSLIELYRELFETFRLEKGFRKQNAVW